MFVSSSTGNDRDDQPIRKRNNAGASQPQKKALKKAFADSPHGEPSNGNFQEVEGNMISNTVMPISQAEKDAGMIMDPLEIDVKSAAKFLSTPVTKGKCVMCYVMRMKSGMFNKYPTWHLFVDPLHRAYANKFLCAAKRKLRSKCSNYAISLDKDVFDKGSTSSIGKIRSNFVGTEYTIYGPGNKDNRSEIAAIVFENNIMKGGPRALSVLAPPLDGKKHSDMLTKKKDVEGGGARNGYMSLVNKKPTRNEQKKCFELSFNGRVKIPSTKNFQLVSDDEKDERFSGIKAKKGEVKAKGWDSTFDLSASSILLQFGKSDHKRFNLDVTWPLSPLQAFCLCVANCDTKLSVE